MPSVRYGYRVGFLRRGCSYGADRVVYPQRPRKGFARAGEYAKQPLLYRAGRVAPSYGLCGAGGGGRRLAARRSERRGAERNAGPAGRCETYRDLPARRGDQKKISEDLSVYFPATFNDVHEKDATERIIRRTRLVLSEITTEQDASEDIGRIDDFILMQNPPQAFSTVKGADVLFDKNYTDIMLLVSKSMKMDARDMTVLEFYQALAYMKNEAKKLRRRVN